MQSPHETPPASSTLAHLDNEAMVTPTRKVKALLAQFEDSDSDQAPSTNDRLGVKIGSPQSKTKPEDSINVLPTSPDLGNNESGDEEGRPGRPTGRLAGRMQATETTQRFEASDADEHEDDDSGTRAYERIKQRLAQKSTTEAVLQTREDNESSEDELQQFDPNRVISKKTRSGSVTDNISSRSTRSPSPLFFPSPSTTRSQMEPQPRRPSQDEAESDDLPEKPLEQRGSKFLALVGKHRKARLAREAVEEAKRAERLAQLKKAGSRSSSNPTGAVLDGVSDESDMSDGSVGGRMTQPARPARKASKKALEEMNRETQRMSRSMQLAHQAKTKKKITKESLLARFNFGTSAFTTTQTADAAPISNTTSSAPASDIEAEKAEQTPPTSPLPSQSKDCQTQEGLESLEGASVSKTFQQPGPSAMNGVLIARPALLDKGKGKTGAIGVPEALVEPTKRHNASRSRQIRFKGSNEGIRPPRTTDSDSDLEIVTAGSKAKKIAAFERLSERKGRETTPHLILRSLANLQAVKPSSKRPSMSAAEMESRLRRAARLQAHREREEKIQKLRSKGVFIPNDEERLKEQQEVEDLVEQERQKNVELQRREKELAKQDGTYVKDQLLDEESDDEDDADFQDEDEIEDHASGSEEEDEEADNDDDEQEGEESDIEQKTDAHEGDKMGECNASEQGNAKLSEQEADVKRQEDRLEPVQSQREVEEIDYGHDNIFRKQIRTPKHIARTRRPMVVSDDEDDEGHDDQRDTRRPSPPLHSKTPQSIPRSARKIIPGLQMSDDLPIGLTQAFAATMAENETQNEDVVTQQQDPPATMCELPSPQFNAAPSLHRLESTEMVTDSQPATQTQPLGPNLSSLLSQGVSQPQAATPATQLSFMPTQDVGCILSPFKENRFDSPSQEPLSTIDTVPLPQAESPVIERRSRLRRGRNSAQPDDVAENGEGLFAGLGLNKSAFSIIGRATKEASQQAIFDKAKSNAKEVVEEAAEESEDEYAGLGGASDDEEGDEDEADRQMIDDDEKLGRDDEANFAGFFADRERRQDEAVVSKLYKDVTTGALRRKRGAADDLDLSDEEDANARRREAKRREFARMRRELLKDEAVGKIAEDKKKQAFLKSIEDRDDPEDEVIDFCGEEEAGLDSQTLLQPTRASSQEEVFTSNNRVLHRRPLEPSAADITNRPAAGKPDGLRGKPYNLAEVRQHISFLIEEPDSQNTAPDMADSDGEAEAYIDLDRHLHIAGDETEEPDKGVANFIVDDDKETTNDFQKPQLPPFNRPPATERRTKANVIDRLSLLRQASSSSSSSATTTASGNGSKKLAFLASTSAENVVSQNSTFKPPTAFLLRRSTTNSSGFNSDTGANIRGAVRLTERGAAEHEKETVRKAQGGQRSSVNYYAKGRVEERERERMGRSGSDRMGKSKPVATRQMEKKNKQGGKAGFLGGLFRHGSWE